MSSNFTWHVYNKASTKSFGENFCKSSILSPTPIYLTGIPSLFFIDKIIPPFAVPSSFVNTNPVIFEISLNSIAWFSAFWPVVESKTR